MQSGEALLVEKLARLGVEDPYGAARSEIIEDIPRLPMPDWNDSCGPI